ncbi:MULTISPECIES: MlaD family protein [Rufibacter]|uniref:Phospholipid/cholesterol/gamma-HCH transport system substrate-binding protein n=1 Tax=Rufibacter quisquiliarum TaxID=1549639 RepID=A0A839GGT4_9BACT|nr:MlaD family protein [Rufibacter ruber]MBA9076793.1 phospholipid/cholesterol/gamma-HCH transport system substrate-binding protein [Rufibacter quisquiliarum]
MKFSKELKVALLGIVAVVLLYVGYIFLKGTDIFSDTRTYYVTYQNVEGLTKSNPVVLNGLRVGLVQEMQLQQNKGNAIMVTLAINKDIEVGDSTVAQLVSSDLLGGKSIELYMGRNRTRYEGGEHLIPFQKESLTDMFTKKAMPVLDTVDSTLVRLNQFLDKDAKRSIQSILLNAEATSEALRMIALSNQGNINQITGNLAALTASLRGTEAKFSQLASNLNTLSDTFDIQSVNRTIRGLDSTVAQAQLTMRRLNENTGTLGRIMNDDSLYRNLNASSESLNALLMDLKANPKRYVHFSLLQIGGGTKVDKAGSVKEAAKVKNATNVQKAGTVEEVEKN